MTVGIVIVTYKCRDLAIACIESVEAHLPDLVAAIVVVDNASDDGTAAAIRARWPAIRVVENRRNTGFAAAVNRGIEAIKDVSVVCLLNPDATLLDAGIPSAASYLEAHPRVGVLGGKILNANGTVQASARSFPSHRNALFNRHSLTTKLLPRNRWSRAYLLSDWKHDEIRTVDWVSGALMLIHRRAIDAVGLFDAGYFFSIEDVDFCKRVRDAGLSVEYFPAAAVRHRIGGSSRKAVYRAMAAHHRGMWRYYAKHMRGSGFVDGVTFAGIWARFSLHAVSYAARSARNRVLRYGERSV
ncbi:MAG: glycosyltransferase family 2 protein [bacterium]